MEKEKLIIGNLEVSYRTFKKEGNNKKMLIIHGWGGSSDSWIKVGENLSKNGIDVIIPDYPGFGDTKIDKIYNIEDYALFIESFAKELNLENFILMGHSNGGRISIELENRGILKIKKLILNNSAGIKRPLSKKQRIFGLIAKCFKIFKKIPGVNYLRNFFYRAIGGHDYLALNNELIKATFLNMIGSDSKEEIEKIKTETLLIWGENDTYTPLKDGKIMNNLIKKSKLIILDGEKHGIHLQNPDRLAKTILENL
ncbi:MAG: alpha/beta hydrolase [Candidatus Gracilibacteria bacterium]|nr:alpha/beta hydrolase [Candidatus Gracilibacteria bacterium]